MDRKLIKRTMDVQRELVRSGLNRRNLLKLGVLSATSGMLLPIQGLSLRAASAAGACPIPGKEIFSPKVRPFKDPLQRLHEMTPLAAGIDGVSGGRPGPRPVAGSKDSKLRVLQEHPDLATATPYADLAHQAWVDPASRLYAPPQEFYELRATQHRHVWHSDMPAGAAGQTAWGFAPPGFDVTARPLGGNAPSIAPGPVFRTRYGRSHLVRIHNDLPDAGGADQVSALGFATPTLSTHMHNSHSPSESDGGPLYYNYSGGFWDYHYPNLYAGINQGYVSPGEGVRGDYREALGSMWYHDHKLDFTAQNVYAGMFGVNVIYDEVDTGDETRAGTTGVRFPSRSQDAASVPHEFDVPLVFHDRQFDPDGVDFFPLSCFDGAIGDTCTVNGTIQPVMRVQPRRYRFRLYVGGPSRFMWWWLRQNANSSTYLPFTVIATDGNLLPAAQQVQSFKQSPGERFDIIVDFSKFAAGTELFMSNRAEQTSGNGPNGKLLPTGQGMDFLKFVVEAARPNLTDNSTSVEALLRPGTLLRPLPDAVDVSKSRRKEWVWGKSGGAWSANGTFYDRFEAPYEIKEGSAEVWVHKNGGGSWSHPIHPHYEEARILSQKGTASPSPNVGLEGGRKDTYRLDPSATMEVAMRFRDYKGIYPVHCHNGLHEDHGMMAMWKIV